jgi:hypothetical protein
MEADPKPVYAPGNRNALCPFYERCLDYAVAKHWRFWDCRSCPHKARKTRLADGPVVKDANPEYTLPADLF